MSHSPTTVVLRHGHFDLNMDIMSEAQLQINSLKRKRDATDENCRGSDSEDNDQEVDSEGNDQEVDDEKLARR